MITREFKLYLNAGIGVAPVINANQFDQSEEWVFTLLQSDGTVYTPSTGAIIGLKQDGTTILNAGTVNSSGQVVITETEQITAVPGSNLFEILIDGNTHGTANFVVFVERRPGDIDNPSESDISLFQEAIDAAGNIEQFQADISALQSGLSQETQTRQAQDTSLASQIAQEASTRSQQDAVLQAEIDQIIAPSGEAPSAAEVQNARIGVDGTTYDTLGNAIRGQVSDLKNALDYGAGKPDLLASVQWTDNYSIDASGVISAGNGFRYSSLIPVTEDNYTLIYLPNGTNRNTRVHGYDANGDWVKQIEYQRSDTGTGEKQFTFHVSGVNYIRISTGSAQYTTLHGLFIGSGSNYDEVVLLDANINEMIDEIVAHTPNLFNADNVVDGYFVGGDYFVGANAAYSYIKLKLEAGTYVFADLSLSAATDTIIVCNGDTLSTVTPQMTKANKYVTFTVPANTYEVAISYRNASVNKNTAMVVKSSTRPATYIKYGYVPNKLYLPNINEVTVKKDGTGDFTSFVDAIQSITDSSEYNRYIVYVYEGTYDIVDEFFGGTITAVQGLVIPNYVDIIGVGLVDNIVLDGTLPDDTTQAISTAFSTINLKYNNTLKNITVKGKNVRYAVHDESGNQFKNYVRNVENCVFITAQNVGGLWQNNSAYGHGLSDDCKVKFKNCKFETVSPIGGVGAYICHDGDGQVKPCYVEFENCSFKKSPYASFGAFRAGTYSGLCESYININGCNFNDGAILIKEEVANSGTGIKLIPVGYANRNFTTTIKDSTGEYTEAEVY